jgi:hypothetical protein
MAGVWILFILFLGIFFWSFLPAPIAEKSYPVEFNQPILQYQDCQIENIFEKITFQTKHPTFVNFGSLANFKVILHKKFAVNSSSEIGCTYNVELLLEMEDALIKPNNRLIQPVADSKSQLFIFEVQPVKYERRKAGELWIYWNSTSPGTQAANRLPLFVIPVEIEIRSLFGIPSIWVRIGSLAAIFILLILKILNQRPG